NTTSSTRCVSTPTSMTARSCGYALEPPRLTEGRPNQCSFSGVSGVLNVVPSTEYTACPRQRAPDPIELPSRATWRRNTTLITSQPTRSRAWEIDVVCGSFPGCHVRLPNADATRESTS